MLTKPQTVWLGAFVRKTVSVERVAGATQDVLNFVLDELLDLGSRRAEEFAWIKLLGVLREGLADASGHRQAKVGINVHLRAAHAARDFDVRLGHPDALRRGCGFDRGCDLG